MAEPYEELIATFEAEGVEEVRRKIASRVYNAGKEKIAKLWLENREKADADAAQSREEGRRDREITILDQATRASWISAASALAAVVISVVALIVSLYKQ